MSPTFQQAMQNAGIRPPTQIIADGTLHRFTVSGDKPRSENGWYVLHLDDPAAGAFGCWKRGVSETWSGKAYQRMNPAEKVAYTAKMEAMKQQRKEELKLKQTECRVWCTDAWAKAKDATNENSYLKRKGVNAYGLKSFEDTLLVPVRDMAGTIHGLQFIAPAGSKKFKTGTNKAGYFFTIGNIKDNTIIICEGYATGASIHQATGQGVVIAFDSGNLFSVARNIRSKNPEIKIIIAADDDHATKGNPGLTKATDAARAVDGLLAKPEFPNNRGAKDTDFNDLAQLAGLEAVKICIEAAAMPSPIPAIENHSQQEKQLPFVFRKFSDIQAKPIQWLWQGRIARGKVSIVAGHPGLGKSQVELSMAAIVSKGGLWPVDRVRYEPGNVIIFSAEDDAADTIRPRLDAAGADVSRVFILDAVLDTTGERRSFNLAAGLERLGLMIDKIGGAALIIIDPISAYLGGTDSHKNADVRALLAPLAELAAKYDAAIVGVSHLNKCVGGEALTRIMGSLAFVAAARAAYLIVKDPEDSKRRLFLPVKNNIGNDNTGLAFTIESKTLPGDIETSLVVWESGPVTVTADEVMQPQVDSEERSAIDDAKEFLNNILVEGPLTSKQVQADAEGAGHSWRTIQRAQKLMEIKVRKNGMTGPWMWELPLKNAKDCEGCQANNVAVFGNVGSLQQTAEPIPSFTAADFPNLELPL
jgi:putative DNA primase/helicase